MDLKRLLKKDVLNGEIHSKQKFVWENHRIIVGMGVYMIALEDRRFVFVFNNQMIEG